MIEVGDCRVILPRWKNEGFKARTCVTSPPYFGLRDYGADGQCGLEKTPQEYVDNLVAVFRLVRDVLTDDGTLWLNLGDSYSANRSYQVTDNKYKNVGNHMGRSAATIGLKPKNLIGIPWRVAFALQADGWCLRQDIIWSKPNPMPESVRDRCTKSHEYIFMLTKSERYHYNAAAIAEPLTCMRMRGSGPMVNPGTGRNDAATGTRGDYRKPYKGKATKDFETSGAQDASATKARIVDGLLSGRITTRNKRSVWTVTPKPFKGAHFATFPPDLIEPCILAGSVAGDTVIDPFGGSGTTGMVAAKNNRQFRLIELNPAYADIARARCAPSLEDLLK